MNILESLKNFWETTGINRLIQGTDAATWQTLLMLVIVGVLVYLAIVKGFEPLLLLPIAIGMLLTNLPGGGMFHSEYWFFSDYTLFNRLLESRIDLSLLDSITTPEAAEGFIATAKAIWPDIADSISIESIGMISGDHANALNADAVRDIRPNCLCGGNESFCRLGSRDAVKQRKIDSRFQESVKQCIIREKPILRMEHSAAGEIGQKHADGNRKQQKRLKSLDNGKIDQNANDHKHQKRLPRSGIRALNEAIDSRRLPKVFQTFKYIHERRFLSTKFESKIAKGISSA